MIILLGMDISIDISVFFEKKELPLSISAF